MKQNSTLSKWGRSIRATLFVGMMLWGWSAQADITSNLMLHYDFDGLSPEETLVPDKSGLGNNGSRMGNALYEEGKTGQALAMRSTDDYVFMPDGVLQEVTDLTIGGWFYKETSNTWDRLFDFANSTDINMFVTTNGEGNICRFAIKNIDLYTNSATRDEQRIDGVNVVFGRWNHLAVTLKYDEAGKGVGVLYLNGIKVGENSNFTLKPSDLGMTTQNYIGKSIYSADPAFNGKIDDFRIYQRALTAEEIKDWLGTPVEIAEINDSWDLYDYFGWDETHYVNSDIALPTSLYDGRVTVKWESSDTTLVRHDGSIKALPERYYDAATLSAIFTQEQAGEEFMVKKSFMVRFMPADGAEPAELEDFILAKFEFTENNMKGDTIFDLGKYRFAGVMKEGARVVSMGGPIMKDTVGVLHLDKTGEYFDMGKEIGKAVQGLTDYTISVFFRKDNEEGKLEYFSGFGQWLYGFSNSSNLASDAWGAMYYEPKRDRHVCTPDNYSSEGSTMTQFYPEDKNPLVGDWHNITFVQSGETGTLYHDGVAVATSSVQPPYKALKEKGKNPPIYNYIGKPSYDGDPYLTNTHIGGFYIYSLALSAEDLQDPEIGLDINNKLARLKQAYAENPFIVGEEFQQEYESLSIDYKDLTEVDVLDLPTQGSIDDNISISWTVSHPDYIDVATGKVTQPLYFDADSVVLTATLQQGITSKKKTFTTNVLVKGGYQNDLVADFDFADAIHGQEVVDKGEMGFVGKLMNEAYIVTIGSGTNQRNVLQLTNGEGYFDMGTEIGKAIVGLEDYTLSIFFRKDDNMGVETVFSGFGQWLYGFSNAANLASDAWGAMYYEPKRDRHVCTPDNYASEPGTKAQGFSDDSNTLVGLWHNLTYVQQGDSGTLYHDGIAVNKSPVQTPKQALWHYGLCGTPYNYIGKPSYSGDPYLNNAMIARLVIYKKTMDESELASTLKIEETLLSLDAAYAENNGSDNVLIIDLKKVIDEAKYDLLLDYPGKADLEAAISDAEQAISNNIVTEETIQTLQEARLAYKLTMPASGESSADFTFVLANPSFEAGNDGVMDEMSIYTEGNFNVATGWTAYVDCEGWTNVVSISDGPSDGKKGFEMWAATIRHFDIYQVISLPAGYYTLSADARTNAPGPWTTRVYADLGQRLYESVSFDETMNDGTYGWNSAENFQNLKCTFEVKETDAEVRIGLRSENFMQFDNFQLTCFGSDQPADDHGTILTGLTPAKQTARMVVFAKDNVIYVQHASQEVQVFDVTGRQLMGRDNQFAVKQGLYLVRSGNELIKVLVK